MKLLLLLATIGGALYILWLWFDDYQASVERSSETPAGFEGGIRAPIESAGETRDLIE